MRKDNLPSPLEHTTGGMWSEGADAVCEEEQRQPVGWRFHSNHLCSILSRETGRSWDTSSPFPASLPGKCPFTTVLLPVGLPGRCPFITIPDKYPRYVFFHYYSRQVSPMCVLSLHFLASLPNRCPFITIPGKSPRLMSFHYHLFHYSSFMRMQSANYDDNSCVTQLK